MQNCIISSHHVKMHFNFIWMNLLAGNIKSFGGHSRRSLKFESSTCVIYKYSQSMRKCTCWISDVSAEIEYLYFVLHNAIFAVYACANANVERLKTKYKHVLMHVQHLCGHWNRNIYTNKQYIEIGSFHMWIKTFAFQTPTTLQLCVWENIHTCMSTVCAHFKADNRWMNSIESNIKVQSFLLTQITKIDLLANFVVVKEIIDCNWSKLISKRVLKTKCLHLMFVWNLKSLLFA